MSHEFVVIDDGVETDWIDPVVSVSSNNTVWEVNNGFYDYSIPKYPGRLVYVRLKEN